MSAPQRSIVMLNAPLPTPLSNTRTPGPVAGTLVQTGEQRSRGIEFGLAGRVRSGWDVSAGYALQDAEIREATAAAPAGRAVAQVPKHQLSLWNKVSVGGGFGLGLGVTYASRSFASISNQVTLPAYTRVDGALFYRIAPGLQAQLNVENLFARAKALDPADPAGGAALRAFDDFNRVAARPVYEDTDRKAMLDALEIVGLGARVTALPAALDTLLASSGWPLTVSEVMELKLANALLARPHVLVLSPLFDVMPPDRLADALARLEAAGTTVLLCTARPGPIALDGWMWLGRDGQRRFASQAELEAFLAVPA